jgi:hypothetical protein
MMPRPRPETMKKGKPQITQITQIFLYFFYNLCKSVDFFIVGKIFTSPTFSGCSREKS